MIDSKNKVQIPEGATIESDGGVTYPYIKINENGDEEIKKNLLGFRIDDHTMYANLCYYRKFNIAPPKELIEVQERIKKIFRMQGASLIDLYNAMKEIDGKPVKS